MSTGIIETLRKWKKEQSIEGLKIGKPLQLEDRIFTMHPDTASSWFVKFVKRHKDCLPQDITIHSLRHANISLQLYAGVDPKTASVRAGHSNVRNYNEYLPDTC